MFARLRGQIVEQLNDGAMVLDVGGVGYEVFVPIGALGRIPGGGEGADITLHIHTHVREDAITLYGFVASSDRAAFRTLLTVSSVGPKLALSIMSHFSADELARAIASSDRAAFKGISGVGPKIVERLVLELKDKLTFRGEVHAPLPLPVGSPRGKLAQVSAVLVSMGFRKEEADRAVNDLPPEGLDRPVDALLREALAKLS